MEVQDNPLDNNQQQPSEPTNQAQEVANQEKEQPKEEVKQEAEQPKEEIKQEVHQQQQEVKQEADQPKQEEKQVQEQQKQEVKQVKEKSKTQQKPKQAKSKSPERKNVEKKKRQSSQPATEVNKEVVDQLLQEQKDKKKKEFFTNKFTEKIQNYLEDIKNKRENKQKEIEKYEMKECTFKPQIKSKPNQQSRNANEFIEQQMKFEKQKKEKIQSKREELLEQQLQQEKESSVFKSFTCQGSTKIMSGKQVEKKPIYERLFKLSVKQSPTKQKGDKTTEENKNAEGENALGEKSKDEIKKTKSGKEKEEDKNQFKPQINPKSQNLVREGKIEDLLYNLAKNKPEKKKRKKDEEEEEEEKKDKKNSSKKILRKKLISEFKEQIQQAGVPTRVNYATLKKILQQLHFTKNNQKEANYQIEQQLQKLLWDVFQGDEKDGIYNKNLLKFILSLNNLYEENIAEKLAKLKFEQVVPADPNQQQGTTEITSEEQGQTIPQQTQDQSMSQQDPQPSLQTSEIQNPISEEKKEEENQNESQAKQEEQKIKLDAKTIIEQQKYGFFQENDFIINNQQAFKIFIDFKIFYDNRYAQIKYNTFKQAKVSQEVQPEFKPQVDKNSERMAKLARERKGDSDIVEHLLSFGKETEKKLKEKKEQLDQARNELPSFQPDLTKPIQIKEATEHEEKAASKEPRFQRLFNLQKELKEKEESRLKKKEEEEEKKIEEMPFKPVYETSDYQQIKQETKQTSEIKGFETIINRFQQGRALKERIESIQERGKNIIREPGSPQTKLSYMNKKSQQLLKSKKMVKELPKEGEDPLNMTQQDLKLQQLKKEDEERMEKVRQVEEKKKQERQKKQEEQKKQKEEQMKVMSEKRKQEELTKKQKKQQLLEETQKIKQQKLDEMLKLQKEKQETNQPTKVLPQTAQEIKKQFEEEMLNIKFSPKVSFFKQLEKAKTQEKPKTQDKPKKSKQKVTITSRFQRIFQKSVKEEKKVAFEQKGTSQALNEQSIQSQSGQQENAQEFSQVNEQSSYQVQDQSSLIKIDLSTFGVYQEIQVGREETVEGVMEKFLTGQGNYFNLEFDEETKIKIQASIQDQIQLAQT